MACAKGPAEFCPDGDASVVSTSWTTWVEEFEAFADSKGIFNLTGDAKKDMRAQRKALLLYHAGARVREIHRTLTATDRHAYDDFLTGLNTYFTVEPNNISSVFLYISEAFNSSWRVLDRYHFPGS